MNTSILIVSHAKDIEWLNYCLASIKTFAKGFGEVVVVVPNKEMNRFADIIKTHLDRQIRWVGFDQEEHPLGQLHHQVQKCLADVHCKGADSVLHFDSDCIFRTKVTPEDFSVGNKPILLVDKWNNAGNGIQWKPAVDKALGVDTQFETMRWMTSSYLVSSYEKFRSHISRLHRTPFERYVLSQRPYYPEGFAEFNTIGNFVLMDHPELYEVRNISKDGWPPIKYIQFWSHGGLGRVIPEEGQEFKGKTPMEVISATLGLRMI